MPKFNMAVSHSLTQDEAVKRVKNLINDVKKDFADKIQDSHEEWDGNMGKFSFSVMHLPVSGILNANKPQVEISGNLPLAALPLKKKIEAKIKEQAETLLA